MATDKSDEELAQQHGISLTQIELLRQSRGLTAENIEKIPSSALQSTFRRVDFPDMPRQRLSHRYQQDANGSDTLNEIPLARALQQLDALKFRGGPNLEIAGLPTAGVPRSVAGPGAPPPAAGLAVKRWEEIGPGGIGGRTRSILPHPIDVTRIWLGSVGGGVWRTDDSGGSWRPVDDFMANLAVTSLVMDPADANIIYAGTGEGFGNLGSLRGAGIFRTVNGSDWNQIPSTNKPEFRQINRLAISSDSTRLLAATNQGVFLSSDPARTNWKRVMGDMVADVKFHPTDPNHAIAGSLRTGKVWHTSDGGQTWIQSTHADNWSGRAEVCYAVADPATIYVSLNISRGEIWRSQDGGVSFTKRNSRNSDGLPARYLGEQGWYDNVIWAGDPTNVNLVIVGGIDLWKSKDGGDSLIEISTWWDSRSAHADHHVIVSDPNFDGVHNKVVFFGNDGGIYRANDVTTVGTDPEPPRISGWEDLNNNYAVTQFYGGAVNPTTGVIVCGAQDNGTLAYHPADKEGEEGEWIKIFGGDGGYCAHDPTDPNVFYGEYVFLNIFRNTDGATTSDSAGDRYISGRFWNPIIPNWDWKPQPFRIPDAFNENALFIAPFVLDPSESNRILAGGKSLWRTNDAKSPNTPSSGPQWREIKAPENGLISAIAIDPTDSDHVWVGYTDGELWKSENATDSSPIWVQVNGLGIHALDVSRFMHAVSVSPHDRDSVLVAFGGYISGNVWISDDAGLSWTNLATSLPEVPVRAVTWHPSRAGWLYIGTEVGVFGSEDSGQNWSPVNEGPANVSVDDLIWNGNTLICITHGRGVFSIDLSVAIPA